MTIETRIGLCSLLLVALGTGARAQAVLIGGCAAGGPDDAAPSGTSSFVGCGVLSQCASPNPRPGGIAWDGTHVWQSNYFGANVIQKIDPLTCTVVHTIPAPAPYMGGLTWDGTNLWACAEELAQIFRLDPNTGAILNTIPAPAFGTGTHNSSDLAWDGQYLWHVDYGPAGVYKLDPSNGNVIATLPPPGPAPCGISYSAGTLVISDFLADMIYVVDATNGNVLSSCASPDTHPWGVEITQTGSTWNGGASAQQLFEIDTGLVSGPVVYCTAGTSSHGCVPSIGSVGTPSVAAASGFTISVSALEGQRSGILFYGVNGPQASPWAAGSTSFLCVKAPVQRMSVQTSGGTAGACDGAIGQDWLAFVAANPGCLGAPFASGDVVHAQGWYRDPAAPKTTNLTDALEFTLQP
jgi:hypothetical protein